MPGLKQLPWSPDKKQWRIIWLIYAVVFVASMNWDGYSDTPMDGSVFVVLVVIAGALVLLRAPRHRDHLFHAIVITRSTPS